MKECDCGCLITKQSITDKMCDGCYFKKQSQKDNRDKDHKEFMEIKHDKMALVNRKG